MKKTPFITRDALAPLLEEYPTPFYLYDEGEIRRRARALYATFAWNPGFREFFAVKATPNPFIVSILAEEGCGCDCAGAAELYLARACGMSGSDMILSSNNTPDELFGLAASYGALINIDNLEALSAVERGCGGRLPERMCARVNPGESFGGSGSFVGEAKSSKFGMRPDQLESAFVYMRDHGVKDFGIHAFLSSNTLGSEYYPTLARYLLGLAADLSSRLKISISFLDLSGGIGVAYRPEECPVDIMAVGAGVRRAYEEVCAERGDAVAELADISFYTELGRWMLAPAGALITKVLQRKESWKTYIGVDACAANLMRPAMYGAYHHITVMGKEEENPTETVSVVGGLCENNDRLCTDRELPTCERGDILFVHDAGAHGFSMGYNYNGALRSAEVLLREDGSHQLIRRAETPNDYFSTFDFDPRFAARLCNKAL